MEKELCHSCNENEAGEVTTCPYSEEIGVGEEELCNCCDKCYKKCLNNI